MQVVSIEGKERELGGSSIARRNRSQGIIPCVMYGGEKSIHFSTDFLTLRPLIFTSDFKIAEISFGGATYKSFVKDVQFDPITDNVVHADFQELIKGKKVKVEVPITLQGTPAGVKTGGALVPKLRKVKIKVLPENLVEEILLDISHLELGDSLKVRDLTVSDEMEILAASGITVASVEVPRALKAAEAAEAEAAEALLLEEAEEGAEGEEGATADGDEGKGDAPKKEASG